MLDTFHACMRNSPSLMKTAGLCLAARLSENPSFEVLVLEAGEDVATEVLGDVIAEGAVNRMEAGVVGSCVAARFDGEPGRLYAGFTDAVGRGGGTNGCRAADG